VNSWRLLDTGALPGSLNMAIDGALLRLHARGESPPTLRFTQWQPPAVSLGYFQKRHSLDLEACRHLGIDVVRRPTGGRAVLHQHELTYSVIAGPREGIPVSLDAAYRLICGGLLAAFRLLGLDAELGHENTRSSQGDICFMRSAVGDIVYEGKKFVGSAQAWQGTSLLQHGSIVLAPQNATWSAILTPGIISRETLHARLNSRTISLSEILGRGIQPEELKAAIRAGMAQALQVEFQVGEMSPEERALAGIRTTQTAVLSTAIEPSSLSVGLAMPASPINECQRQG
jgi:lipoate-protein ligase A